LERHVRFPWFSEVSVMGRFSFESVEYQKNDRNYKATSGLSENGNGLKKGSF
jgi:hypothetical protein